MNTKLLFPTLIAATLATACASQLGSTDRIALLGDPAPLSAATRTILITPNTRYVNVTGGEVVKFVVGDKSFAWSFDAAQYIAPVEVNRLAPPGILDYKVLAYLEPNPLYKGGDHSDHGRPGTQP